MLGTSHVIINLLRHTFYLLARYGVEFSACVSKVRQKRFILQDTLDLLPTEDKLSMDTHMYTHAQNALAH